mmetsp:Transcript_8974/g.21824  ORF Transcript_8974/g.21824 Transcript_8974/m.21824 type:complete len:221 (+) Transcript_8974:1769-2431(+)
MMSIPNHWSSRSIIVPIKSYGIPAVGLSQPQSPSPLAEDTSSLPWIMDTSCGPSRANSWLRRALRHFISSNGVHVKCSRPRKKLLRYPRTSRNMRNSSMHLTRPRSGSSVSRRPKASERAVPSSALPWIVLRNGGQGKSRNVWICLGDMIARMMVISSQRRLQLRLFLTPRRNSSTNFRYYNGTVGSNVDPTSQCNDWKRKDSVTKHIMVVRWDEVPWAI